MSAFATFNARRRRWWVGLAPREQRMVSIAVALVLAALLWWVALAPALRTLGSAPAAHALLDAQLQQMTTLQAQARALQGQPRTPRDDALRALESSVRESLGPNAQLQVSGDGATVAVRTTPPDVLAQWLAQARGNARAVPREVHITRSQGAPSAVGPIGASAAATLPGAARSATAVPAPLPVEAVAPRWDGTLVMSLPAR